MAEGPIDDFLNKVTEPKPLSEEEKREAKSVARKVFFTAIKQVASHRTKWDQGQNARLGNKDEKGFYEIWIFFPTADNREDEETGMILNISPENEHGDSFIRGLPDSKREKPLLTINIDFRGKEHDFTKPASLFDFKTSDKYEFFPGEKVIKTHFDGPLPTERNKVMKITYADKADLQGLLSIIQTAV